MTPSTAKKLALAMRESWHVSDRRRAFCSAHLDGQRIVFRAHVTSYGPRGIITGVSHLTPHSLSVADSSEERVRSHWQGFVENKRGSLI